MRKEFVNLEVTFKGFVLSKHMLLQVRTAASQYMHTRQSFLGIGSLSPPQSIFLDSEAERWFFFFFFEYRYTLGYETAPFKGLHGTSCLSALPQEHITQVSNKRDSATISN